MSTIKTLGIGLELFPISRLVLVLVSKKYPFQDLSWYWSWKKIEIKTSLGIGLERKLKSRQVLVLVLNKISGLAEHWTAKRNMSGAVCLTAMCKSSLFLRASSLSSFIEGHLPAKVVLFFWVIFIVSFQSWEWHRSAQPFAICVFELVFLNDRHYFLLEPVHLNYLFCDE